MAASEGVGAAYDLRTVSCVTYSGRVLEAVTLQTRKGIFRANGDVPPSPAYMGILIEGARSGMGDDTRVCALCAVQCNVFSRSPRSVLPFPRPRLSSRLLLHFFARALFHVRGNGWMADISNSLCKAGLKEDYIQYLETLPTSSLIVFDSRMFSRYFRTGPGA